jgi:hypothetical protein
MKALNLSIGEYTRHVRRGEMRLACRGILRGFRRDRPRPHSS